MGHYDGVSYGLALGGSYSRDKSGLREADRRKGSPRRRGVTHQLVAELHFAPANGQTHLAWKKPEERGADRQRSWKGS